MPLFDNSFILRIYRPICGNPIHDSGLASPTSGRAGAVVAAGAALLGVVMILVKHDLKRVLTSFVGSYFFVSGVDYYLYFVGQHLEEPPSFLPCSPRLWPSVFFKSGFECSSALCYVLLGSWALLFLAGVIVQTKLHAAEKRGDHRRGERQPLLQQYHHVQDPK